MPTNFDQGPYGAPPIFDAAEMASQPKKPAFEERILMKNDETTRLPHPREGELQKGVARALFDEGDIVD